MRFWPLDLCNLVATGFSSPQSSIGIVGLMPNELDLKFVASNENMTKQIKKGFVRYRTALQYAHVSNRTKLEKH